ncbi:MAG: class II aldolase/adducin family protein [Verrucomicrobia bacterium]|nr:class II aldolase/adducin family protein [Verrucomicrobiota bacterium]
MKAFSFLHPRDQIVAIMERIYAHEMTTTSGGNISVRDEGGDVWITPARVDKGNLRRQDIVRIRPTGEREGLYPPSSEHPFHLSVYEVRPDLHAVIHAHPGAVVSFSICGQVPNTRLFPEAWHVCGEAAFARYALPGSLKLGARIADRCGSQARPNCILLENHGVVVGGETLAIAFERFETLEFAAAIILNALLLGEIKYLTETDIEFSKRPRTLSPEGSSQTPSSREKELRKEICDFVHRAYEHRLMTSTWGSFSARVSEDVFVVTASHVDRRELGLEDLVLIQNGRHAPNQIPSRAAGLHRAIYRQHPEIKAVVNALPLNATAFCVSGFHLDTRTIPESYLFLKDVVKIPFEPQFGDGEEVAAVVGPKNPVALLQNNGVLVAGRTVLDAFDRLEVLEATAAAIIRSRALGQISAMGEGVIQELENAFPGL